MSVVPKYDTLLDEIREDDIAGASADPFSQYFLLAGRAGGQTAYGGTASGESLLLRSTSHATKGDIVFGVNNDLVVDETSGFIGMGAGLGPLAALHIAKAVSSTYWDFSGTALRVAPASLTDTSSTGTKSGIVGSSFAISTMIASNVVTYTDAATLYIAGPLTAGANVTITNNWAFWVDSGDVRFDGNARIVGNIALGTAGISATNQVNATFAVTDPTVANSGYNLNFTVGAGATSVSATQTAFTFIQNLTGTGGGSSSLLGFNAEARNSQTAGTLAALVGASVAIRNLGSGGTTNLGYGTRSIAILTAGSTINTYRNFESRAPSITSTGAIVTNYGFDIANQGHANFTNSYALNIAAQSGSATANYVIITQGAGLIIFNETGAAEADVRMEGDTNTSLFHLDTSADTVQINAATASDSAKFYVSGKISASGDIEINSALDHDGTTAGFYNTAPVVQQTVTGSRGGNAALASFLTGLAATGLIIDSSTA